MKLRKEISYVKFLQQVRQCNGEVLFKTLSGDRLNLKSALSEYIFIAAATSPNLIENGVIECLDKGDYALLSEYLED